MREELLEIYSSSGKKTGKKATKSYIHKKGLFHATVHVWIFSEKGNVLIQKRSTKKKLNPGVWDVSVAGHIGYKEDIKAAAIRETFEETNTKVEMGELYAIFNVPQINQVYMLYLAEVIKDDFSATSESLDVKLFNEKEIPWDELAFPFVPIVLRKFFSDHIKGDYPLSTHTIERKRQP